MKMPEMGIPNLFICPISLDLFKDPVTLITGQTYDRSSIEKWLSSGNLTCPVTMQKLHDLSLVPNHTLKQFIDHWLQFQIGCSQFGQFDSLASIKHNLQSPNSSLDTKVIILEQIHALSTESGFKCCCLVQFGFLSLLLELVFDSMISQEHILFVEKALSCVLGLLSVRDYESLNVLKSRLEFFEILFEKGNLVIKESLCDLIEVISSAFETRELCEMLGKRRELLRALVVLVQQNSEGSDAGIRAVSALCYLESNRENLVQEGMVNGIVKYISNGERRERSLTPRALATMELLLGLKTAREAFMNDSRGIRALVKMVFRVSNHEGSESSVRSLIILCSDYSQAREEVISAGVLTQLLLLLQSQCSCRTKTKARVLLKLLSST